MLQSVQSEIGKLLCFGVRVNSHHHAFIAELVRSKHVSSPAPVLNQYCCHSATTASGSACKAFSSALSYPSCNSRTAADTTTLPSSLISIRSDTVSPMNSAEIAYFTAICWTAVRLSRSHEMTTRLASSPNRMNSGGNPRDASSTLIPVRLLNADSARVTAIPPSEQSWAESSNFASAISTSAFCRTASFSSSSSGG